MRWRIIDQTSFHRLDEARLGRWYLLQWLGCGLRGFIFGVVASSYSLVFFFKRGLNSRLKCRSLARIFFFAIRFPFCIALFRDLFHGPTCLDRLVLSFLRGRLGASAGFQYQPLVLFPIPAANSHKRPFAFRFLAGQNEMELAFAQ